VRTRTTGMWWGIAVEAPDPPALARFYATLLDWPVVEEQPGTAVLATSPTGPFVVFQQADGYVPPVWPPQDGQQRPMLHLDVQVGDLDEAVAEAVSLGATLAQEQPQPHVRVLLDPVGHPFCLVRDDG
jgi:catechol 2,3-dioxygenase-like lactoylglutathione lyase family enzyme